MSLEGTKLAPFEAQCNVQKERKGPAGPEKSAAAARTTVRVGTYELGRCVIGIYISTLG